MEFGVSFVVVNFKNHIYVFILCVYGELPLNIWRPPFGGRLVLSCYHMDPRLKLRSADLVSSTFDHWFVHLVSLL